MLSWSQTERLGARGTRPLCRRRSARTARPLSRVDLPDQRDRRVRPRVPVPRAGRTPPGAPVGPNVAHHRSPRGLHHVLHAARGMGRAGCGPRDRGRPALSFATCSSRSGTVAPPVNPGTPPNHGRRQALALPPGRRPVHHPAAGRTGLRTGEGASAGYLRDDGDDGSGPASPRCWCRPTGQGSERSE